jgi:anti-sigma regulatory factor (Ser/Thr protein kinase)
MGPEMIELLVPPGRDWHSVARIVLGGIANRLDLGYEELDDLQLAVEELLVEAASQEPVCIEVHAVERGVRVRVGPLRELAIAEALQGPEPAPGELNLRRVLETVVDSFGVEDAADGAIVVTLQKAAGHR